MPDIAHMIAGKRDEITSMLNRSPTLREVGTAAFQAKSGNKTYADAIADMRNQSLERAKTEYGMLQDERRFNLEEADHNFRKLKFNADKGNAAAKRAMEAFSTATQGLGAQDRAKVFQYVADNDAIDSDGSNALKAYSDAIVTLGLNEPGPQPGATLQQYDMYRQQALEAGEKPMSLIDYQRSLKEAGKSVTNVAVDNTQNEFYSKFGELSAEQLMEQQAAAQDAAQSIQANTQALQLLDQGIISGAGADFQLVMGKLLTKLGYDAYQDAVANTEAFVGQRAQEVGRIIKLFGAGTGLSDADREFARKAAAGEINMDEQSIRRLLRINNEAARNVIENYNKRAASMDPKLLPYDIRVEMPAVEPVSPSEMESLFEEADAIIGVQ